MLFEVLLVALGTAIGSVGALFVKKATMRDGGFLKILLSWKMFWAGFLYALGSVFYLWALSRAEVSYIYPMVALSYVWATLLAMWKLNEKMNLARWVALGLIIVGVIMVSLS